MTRSERYLKLDLDELAKYRDFYDNDPIMHVSVEWETTLILDCNRTLAQNLGYTKEELLGSSIYDLYEPASLERAIEAFRCFPETGEVRDVELQVLRKDGSALDVQLSATAVRGRDGQVLSSNSSWTDITAHREVEQALRKSEERYRTLVENAPEAVVVFDLKEDRFVDCNPRAERLFGIGRDELLRVGIEQVSPTRQPDGTSSRRAAWEQVRGAVEGGTPRFEWIHSNAAGEEIPCEVRLVRLPSADRILVRGSISDIRERKSLETRLAQAQKMEAIGRLVGGIAHDFNNLLTVINGFSIVALEQLGPDHVVHEDLEMVRKAGDKASDLVRQLLAFGRQQVLRPRVVDLNDVVVQFEPLLRRTIGEDIRIRTELAADLCRVRADPGQIEQVLLNLALNARDAMLSGGKLTIETANTELSQADASGHEIVEPGDYALLCVADTGSGMDEETLRRLFEPFFTTKERGGGTGLGLSTAYGIVKQSGGYIWATSEPEVGTVFKIYLPRVEVEAAEVGGEEPAAVGASGGSETVLLAEDNEMVLDFTRRALEGKGYQVLQAIDGEGALALCREHDGPIELLVTDLIMPGGTGVDLAREASRLRPEMATLYISGYADRGIHRSRRLADEQDFLEKPFSAAELVGRVREILDRRAG